MASLRPRKKTLVRDPPGASSQARPNAGPWAPLRPLPWPRCAPCQEGTVFPEGPASQWHSAPSAESWTTSHVPLSPSQSAPSAATRKPGPQSGKQRWDPSRFTQRCPSRQRSVGHAHSSTSGGGQGQGPHEPRSPNPNSGLASPHRLSPQPQEPQGRRSYPSCELCHLGTPQTQSPPHPGPEGCI